jgi:arabinan endo-1,5-alpha-L-arabinosidase
MVKRLPVQTASASIAAKVALGVLAVVSSGCERRSSGGGAPSATGAAADAGSALADAAAEGTFTNPVVAENCPDPGILQVGEDYYAICTTNSNDDRDKFPIRRSRDLVHWDRAGFLFPSGQVPRWARADFWAPEIHKVGDGYVAYFTARDTTDKLCIGAARARNVLGPYTDIGKPFIRDDRAGVIDAHQFKDEDGRRYLYWKIDGNAFKPPEPTWIYGQELSSDGLSLVGKRVQLLRNTLSWEGDVIEGGWMIRHDQSYFLVYSANTFNSDRYATGVARSRSPLGPFEKLPQPILRSSAQWWGPGHGAIVHVGGSDYYLYHAWQPGKVDAAWDKPQYPRMMLLDRVRWEDGWPKINDGTPGAGALPLPMR